MKIIPRTCGIINCGLILTFRISRQHTNSNRVTFSSRISHFCAGRMPQLCLWRVSIRRDFVYFSINLVNALQGKRALADSEQWPNWNGKKNDRNIFYWPENGQVGQWTRAQFGFMFGWIRETPDVNKYHIGVIDKIHFYLSCESDRIQNHFIVIPIWQTVRRCPKCFNSGIDRCLNAVPSSMLVNTLNTVPSTH